MMISNHRIECVKREKYRLRFLDRSKIGALSRLSKRHNSSMFYVASKISYTTSIIQTRLQTIQRSANRDSRKFIEVFPKRDFPKCH